MRPVKANILKAISKRTFVPPGQIIENLSIKKRFIISRYFLIVVLIDSQSWDFEQVAMLWKRKTWWAKDRYRDFKDEMSVNKKLKRQYDEMIQEIGKHDRFAPIKREY